MSIRLRLTLLYSAILAFTLIAFSVILYATQTDSTYGGIERDLIRQATAFAVSQRGEPGPEDQGPPGPSLPNGVLPGRWLQTRGMTGTVLARSFDLSGTSLPLSQKGLQSAQKGSGWFETAQVDGQPLLVYSQPFMGPEGSHQIVQVAFPIGETQQSQSTLRLILMIGSSLAILAAFAMGWVLAGMALGPIGRITQTARAIGAEHDFSHRVRHTGPIDEVGQLALTFNDMLAELEAAYRQLEGALASQRRFVADASHELRTPLTTVRGNMELLRREPPIDPVERREILADTTEEVERLIRLVNQLLVLARADAGQALRREPLSLTPLLEDICRQGKLLAPHNKITCGPPPDVMVCGDRDALKQVLLILLENAHVHTPFGTAIDVTAQLLDGCAVISVSDSGPGILPEALPHIFERFYRGEVSRRGPGTGLGLAIAKELVEAQDGTIEVHSESGYGTRFIVTLPQAAE